MAYVKNILPKAAAYYTLNRATIEGSDLILEAGGYAEISVSRQILPKLTSKMLVVIHPSIFSDYYTNNAVQVDLSVILPDGTHLDYLVSASQTSSGVFNAELEFPEGDFINFIYRISSAVPVTVYNWELCYQEATDLTTVIEGVEQELPKLLYDYNTYAYAVGQKELTVGLITCYLLDNTSLQGHFTLSFFATERCNVHVRIKDNGITELFSPQVYTVEKGYASISIPHAYLNKLATDHAFAVTIQCTNGQLSIPVRGLLYTIDGGYLATRLLDAGIDIEDISIRQITTDDAPSEIWAVGLEGNRLILKKRAYDSYSSVNWQAVKDFGELKYGCVEFRGHWVGRGREEKYTIETESTPYVFGIDANNNLIAYSGDKFDNEIILDTNVTARPAACQGFNSMKYIEQDQGLIIVYIKNGNVYYRQLLYAYDVWQAINLVYDGGDAYFVSVHRLPDYRVGICVKYSQGTRWYITDRTYVNQAVKPELIDNVVDAYSIATVYDKDKAPSTTYITGASGTLEEKLYHDSCSLIFEYPIKLLNNMSPNDLKQYMSISIGSTNVKIKDIKVADKRIEFFFENPVRGGQTLNINISSYALVVVIYNGCYALIARNHSVYLPMNTLRSAINEVNDLTFNGKLITTILPITVNDSNKYTENISTDITTSLQAVITPVTQLSGANSETIETTISSSISIEVVLVGIAPI